VELSGVQLHLGSPGRVRASGVFFAPNDRKEEGLFLSHSIANNLVATRIPRISRFGFIRKALESANVGKLLDLTGIADERRALPVGALSGGNQQKVLIARGIHQQESRLLLFDEQDLEIGRKRREEAFSRIASCQARGLWPSHGRNPFRPASIGFGLPEPTALDLESIDFF
jgi:ABC-type sugar transport system ATPase subunit